MRCELSMQKPAEQKIRAGVQWEQVVSDRTSQVLCQRGAGGRAATLRRRFAADLQEPSDCRLHSYGTKDEYTLSAI